MLLIGWIILSLVFALIGADREIGFWTGLFCCLLLSPIIGLIIILVSKTKEQMEAAKPKVQVADELLKFKDLFDKGVISEEEFEKQKKKLL